MKTKTPLDTFTALTFESRMADSTVKLLERQGARAVSAPSMQEVPLENHQDVFTFAGELFEGKVDILICTTGVGTDMMIKTLESRYELQRILQALSDITIVARGPKPSKVLRGLDLPIDIKVPEPNTWKEILQSMSEHELTSDLDNKQVAIQEYGEPNQELYKALEKQGAVLLPVSIYRWTLPDDIGPLKKGIKAILKGEVQVVLFTSKTQIKHVMKVAEQITSRETFREALNKAWVASIGSVCSSGLKSYGIDVDFEPSRPKLGVFINEIAEQAAGGFRN